MVRKPLTELSAQGRTQQQVRKMGSSHKRTYGKGGTASSRAVLSDPFFDENDVEEQIFKMSLGPVVTPWVSKDDAKAVPPGPLTSVAQKGKEVQSVHGATSDAAAAYTSLLIAESPKPKGLCDFLRWAERVAGAFTVMKVAEGSYGEVFKLERRTTPQDTNIYEGSIFKLIPLRAKSGPSKGQTSVEALVREVQMLKLLDPIPGFARFRDITVLQGPYPSSFTKAYNDYTARRPAAAYNPRPSMYSHDQLWAMIEMDDGGRDLEVLKIPSAYQVYDIFWLTCCALSYAEEYAEFEHRDLHISNICVRPTKPNGSLDMTPDLNASMGRDEVGNTNFGHSGIRTTIIDYTLSRAKRGESAGEESTIIYDPMRSLSIFKQRGKTTVEEYQYATYRKMRAYAVAVEERSRAEDPSRENKKINKWERFLPRTNVMWLECLLFTLLYRSDERILAGSNEVTEALQAKIYQVLKKMFGILGGDEGAGGREPPQSARAVIEIAHAEGLLTEEDLAAMKESLC